MIWRPKSGDRVVLRYGKRKREGMPHDVRGIVTVVARGPKLINAAVHLDDGRVVVVPRGQLFKEKRP
jgi:hypothetical protein